MRELVLVLGGALLVGLTGAGVAALRRLGRLEEVWAWTVALALVSVAFEVAYFAALRSCLRRVGDVPDRWYARSFEHHHRLTAGQRCLVLPLFVAGGVGLVVALLASIALFVAGVQSLRG